MRSKEFKCLPVLFLAFLMGYALSLYGPVKVEEGHSKELVTPYFCPEDHCALRVISWINRANSSIDLAIYSFTHDDISRALINAYNKGVKVRVIMEERNVDKYSEYGKLVKAGIPVKLDENSALMHNKFMIIDGKVVLTGSFNYTNSADKRNDENLVVIASPQVAESYEEEFNEMWSGVFGG